VFTAHDTLFSLVSHFAFSTFQRLNEKAARDDAQSKKLADARAEAAKKTEELHQAKLSAQVSTYASLMKLLCNAVFCSPQFMSSSQCVTLTMLRVTCMPTRQHWLTEAGG
jgi:predicted aminopeptidase